jgi:hypothetical protein
MSASTGGQESNGTRTSETWRRATSPHGPEGSGLEEERWEPDAVSDPITTADQAYPGRVLISSTEDSPARTSASPESEPVSPETAPGSSTSSPESLTLFDPPGCSSKTYPGCFPRTMVGTSASSWERWPTSGTASPGGCSMHATSESPSEGVEYSLSAILEATVDPRYMLSVTAAKGVLRRATARGRKLPGLLKQKLEDAVNQPEP